MLTAMGINTKDVDLQMVTIDGETYYQISNHDQMSPFLMSIVSDSNHWMFIGSNGGITAGRKDADHALFPYYTDDKLIESFDTTGSKTIFNVSHHGESKVWEPFSQRQHGQYNYSRNLYKNTLGNKVLFEEVNHDLELTFRYQWSSSNQYGFIRESTLINHSNQALDLTLLDGIQNIMPHGVNADLQAIRSNLVNAYKRSELESTTGLGIYALSAIIVDRAEPSEALKANTAWSLGLENPSCLLSSSQLDRFRKGEEVSTETDIKAEQGAYFVSQSLTLDPNDQQSWMIIANINQGPSAIADLTNQISTNKDLEKVIRDDVETGCQRLMHRVGASDGFQLTAAKKSNTRHYSNTLFNIMRGGIFDHNYQIEKWDFSRYLDKANHEVCEKNQETLNQLPETFPFQELRNLALQSGDQDFTRLSLEYMPLKFSRRHGDPSRPWNKFSINTRNEEDGTKVLDYEGNWRDIFQNWEALVHAYPEFVESMILKFLNASTFDGYNPYRVTKDGFDWEVIELHDPWSYIGYWGDHQIIYLLKFLEFIKNHYPKRLEAYFDQDLFVYANVPYRIKSYEEISKDPKDTIIFDEEADQTIRDRRRTIGADGALLTSRDQRIVRVNFIEKILATVLAKLSNFIPEAGIWMNTQRPEWNDANNALVGNGVSMVTLYYLRRFFSFFKTLLPSASDNPFLISTELNDFFNDIKSALESNQDLLGAKVSDKQRKKLLDELGQAGSNYRNSIYQKSFSGEKSGIKVKELQDFMECVLQYLDHSIAANKRKDGMYHAYNLMTIKKGSVSVTHLEEMLEGQVAVLSSGNLSSEDSLKLLDSLKASKLFREDQYSYLLYPNKELPGFLEKNCIPKDQIESSALLSQLSREGNNQIVEQDVNGQFHFNGKFKNANDLKEALTIIAKNGYAELAEKEEELVLEIFESVFNHKAFTGRSGTFYGYEGLGSIYWHMVSKLLLAVQEVCLKAIEEKQSEEIIGRLLEHFYEINEGIGVHKSPKLYGAFPTDPYSHTPLGKGAQQPGMTGQVKEDILSRIGELGVRVRNGQIHFDPYLLRADEFLKESRTFNYIDISLNAKSIALIKNTLVFTYCQTPVVYAISENDGIEVRYSNGDNLSIDGLSLSVPISHQLFSRTGEIERISVAIKKTHLK